MAETVKRKSRKSSSASSTDNILSPDGKRLRHDASLSADSELCESDKVLTILNMAREVIPKLGTSVGKTWKFGTVNKSS